MPRSQAWAGEWAHPVLATRCWAVAVVTMSEWLTTAIGPYSPLLPLSVGKGWPVAKSTARWAELSVTEKPWAYPGKKGAKWA
jgi:hypothetical protein